MSIAEKIAAIRTEEEGWRLLGDIENTALEAMP